MSLTVNELIERLQEIIQDAPDEEDYGERVVLLAYQQNYPLQSTVRGVCTSEDAHDWDTPDDDATGDPVCVYIVEGSQHRDRPYAPGGAFEAAQS